MQWWLSVFFFVNGAWVPGAQFDGWAPRAFATEQQCRERMTFAQRECKDHPLPYDAYWMCNAGDPAEKPPVPQPDIMC
jgi:hypothetical protein